MVRVHSSLPGPQQVLSKHLSSESSFPFQTNQSHSLRYSAWSHPWHMPDPSRRSSAPPLWHSYLRHFHLFSWTIRGRKASVTRRLRLGQFCVHRETAGKSSLPQAPALPFPQSCRWRDALAALCPLPFALGFLELSPWEELGPHR